MDTDETNRIDFSSGYWRRRAAAVREMAARSDVPKVKKALLQAAQSYDEMADLFETQANRLDA
jgi:hypothetical protein